MELYLTEKDYQKQMYEEVLPYLKAREKDGYFASFDGKEIHYRIYSADVPKGTVTIFHGYTENMLKYLPLIYVFLQEGYHIAITDLRGHGHSFRYVTDLTLTHIDYFDEYVLDNEVFVHEIVAKLPGPHFLFAHSMGGGIAALFLEKNHDFFSRAVLSSPMIEPEHRGFPLWFARMLMGFFIFIGKGREKVWFFGDYTGIENFETSCASSEARFLFYSGLKKTDDYAINKNPTYRWTYESLGVKKRILKKGRPESITIPLRIYSADQETLVTRSAQDAFINRVKNGTLKEICGTKHEIFRAGDDVLQKYLTDLFSFLSE